MIDFSNKNIEKTIPYISLSGVLEQIQEPFDQIGVATKTYEKHFNDPNSDYYQMQINEIVDAWIAKGDASRHYGKLLDKYIELLSNCNFKKDKTIEAFKLDNNYDNDERLQGIISSFDSFANETHIFDKFELFTREKTLYLKVKNPLYDPEELFPTNANSSEFFYVKGRFDALFRHRKTGKWLVIDWKSSGSIDTERQGYTKNLYGPANSMPALNWYTYTMQVFFYKKALIENSYLPEGTTEKDVAVKIVQLPGRVLESGKNFGVYSPAFEYDSKLMDNIFMFAWKKKNLGI